MEGLRIRFPGYILAEYLRDKDLSSSSQDLSSFNLNLGDFGQARLVASLAGCEARLLVSLSPVSNQDGDQINIECSLLVIDEEANILHQIPPQSSPAPACNETGAELSFSLDKVDVNRFSLIVIPTSLHVTNMGQCLLSSAQTLTDGDRQQANISHQQYLEELKESEQEKKKKFECDLCSFRAMTAVGLKKHLNKQHPYPE